MVIYSFKNLPDARRLILQPEKEKRMDYSLETMSASHREPVIDIFNHFISNSHAAFLAEPVDYEFFDHFLKMARGYPAVVVRDAAQRVVGFAFLRPHYSEAFKRVAEVTYFILPEHTRQGLGSSILELFVEQASPMGIEAIMAAISSKNQESLKFHLKNGFREVGRFPKIGRKFGEDFDVVWLQKRLTDRKDNY